jgi:glycosyltransferase involved in cell wall biosynthesis
MAGLRIFRSLGLGCKKVRVGPSLEKLFLDFFLFFTVLRLLFKNSYDAIHTHEEACFYGAVLSRLWRIPHVYDMHSSLSQQFTNFNITNSALIHRVLRFFEKRALKHSDAIIAICPYLGEHVRSAGIGKRVFIIENTPEADMFFGDPETQRTPLREDSRFKGRSIILYAGTFEHYQGLDLLMECIPLVVRHRPETLFLLIGGDKLTLEQYRALSEQLGVRDNVMLMEKIPVEEVVQYTGLADVLVSPRKSGTNTPLKIYAYLRSGRPIVATNLVTHTQVLNSEIAILTDPTPEAFAEGIVGALENPDVRSMAQRARHVAEQKYSYQEYIAKTSRLYAYVGSLRKPDQFLNDNASETVV